MKLSFFFKRFSGKEERLVSVLISLPAPILQIRDEELMDET
jgi:hypothetical protein